LAIVETFILLLALVCVLGAVVGYWAGGGSDLRLLAAFAAAWIVLGGFSIVGLVPVALYRRHRGRVVAGARADTHSPTSQPAVIPTGN
jgi:hypothetical protein